MRGKKRMTEGGRNRIRSAVCLMVCLVLMGAAGCSRAQQGGGYRQISAEEAAAVMEEETDYIILDVRTMEEYRESHIPGAVCVPNETIGEETVSQLPDKEQLILVYCRSGNRSKQASEKLVKLGYSNVVEFGGIRDWEGETVTGDDPGTEAEETEEETEAEDAETEETDSASIAIIGGADGPTSIFIAGKIGDEEGSGAERAAPVDLETRKKEPWGVAELDWVRADRISLHGNFGYLSFSLQEENGVWKAEPAAAFSMEEVGTFITQGAHYTEFLGSEDSVLVVTNAYVDDAEKEFFLYQEKTRGGVVYRLPREVEDTISELMNSGGFRDAYVAEEYREPVSEAVLKNPGSCLVYGPVCIPEYDSIVCGFLAADGENLEDLWYGIWWERDGHVVKIPLFTAQETEA